jgi:curli production assembly/transport component CsgF
MKRAFSCAIVVFFATFAPAYADILYKPLNPSFGGDSFNSNHLQSLATSQNRFSESNSSSRQTSTERFLSMLESRLYSSLASQVSDAIFGEDAQPSGTIVFDDQQITFLNTGTEIQLTVTDFTSGQVTNIVIPTLATP